MDALAAQLDGLDPEDLPPMDGPEIGVDTALAMAMMDAMAMEGGGGGERPICARELADCAGADPDPDPEPDCEPEPESEPEPEPEPEAELDDDDEEEAQGGGGGGGEGADGGGEAVRQQRLAQQARALRLKSQLSAANAALPTGQFSLGSDGGSPGLAAGATSPEQRSNRRRSNRRKSKR